jgi:hypothetical protein
MYAIQQIFFARAPAGKTVSISWKIFHNRFMFHIKSVAYKKIIFMLLFFAACYHQLVAKASN